MVIVQTIRADTQVCPYDCVRPVETRFIASNLDVGNPRGCPNGICVDILAIFQYIALLFNLKTSVVCELRMQQIDLDSVMKICEVTLLVLSQIFI